MKRTGETLMRAGSNGKRSVKKRKGRILMPHMRLVVLLVFVSCVGIMANTFRIYRQITHYEAVREDVNTRIEEEKKEQEELKAKVSDMGSDAYIQQQAREKLGLVFDNEIIFKKRK